MDTNSVFDVFNGYNNKKWQTIIIPEEYEPITNRTGNNINSVTKSNSNRGGQIYKIEISKEKASLLFNVCDYATMTTDDRSFDWRNFVIIDNLKNIRVKKVKVHRGSIVDEIDLTQCTSVWPKPPEDLTDYISKKIEYIDILNEIEWLRKRATEIRKELCKLLEPGKYEIDNYIIEVINDDKHIAQIETTPISLKTKVIKNNYIINVDGYIPSTFIGKGGPSDEGIYKYKIPNGRKKDVCIDLAKKAYVMLQRRINEIEEYIYNLKNNVRVIELGLFEHDNQNEYIIKSNNIEYKIIKNIIEIEEMEFPKNIQRTFMPEVRPRKLIKTYKNEN